MQNRNVNTLEAFQNSELDLKNAEASYNSTVLAAKANLAVALASAVELDVSRQARRDLDVRAPQPSRLPPGLNGPVVYAVAKRAVTEGQMAREGDTVTRLVIENPLRLWANVPERFNPDVANGQEVRISVPAYADQTFPGKVAWVNPAVDSASRTFQVEVTVPNYSRLLRPGGFAKVTIVTREQERVVVPVESIIHTAGVTKLFVVRDDKARWPSQSN